LEALRKGDLAREEIDDRAGNEERGHAIGFFEPDQMLGFDERETADARAHEHADLRSRRVFDGELGLLECLQGGREPQLDETIHPTELFLVDVRRRVEVLHFAGEMHVELRGIEVRDVRRARLAFEHGVPSGLDVVAQWRDAAEPCDDDSAT
jgi:hypothetical protein